MRIKNIINNFILEKWNPSNKKKHAACKAKVKARVDDWPSAYASGQVVQCYYENTMINLKRLIEKKMPLRKKKEDCGCSHETINEERKNGSPWFIDKDTRKTSRTQIPRSHPKRSYMSSGQQRCRKKIGMAMIKAFKKRGGKLTDKAPNSPAKTMKEVMWARATSLALDGKCGTSSGKKKKKK